MTVFARASVFAIAALLLGACSFFPEREPITIYQPSRGDMAAPAAPASWPGVDWSLVVARPVAGQQLDSERINVMPAPGTVQVYRGAAWSDAVPDLLHVALLTRFEESGKILSVSRAGGGVRGRYQLLTDLRSFTAEYAQPGQPQAVIEVYVRLVRSADGEVVAARGFREAEPAASEDVGDVVSAFSRSLDRLTGAVVGWSLASGNQGQTAAAR